MLPHGNNKLACMHGRGLRIDEGVDLCKGRVDHSWMDQPPQVVYRVVLCL